MKRSLFAASLLLSTAWTIFPAHAQVDKDAQGNVAVMARPRPEYDALGTRVGAFSIYPSVTLAAEYNDNVFAEENNKQSDIIFSVQPYVTANSNWGRHALTAAIGAIKTYHRDFDSENLTDWWANADGRLDLFRQSTLGFGVGHSDLHESRYAAESGSTGELNRYLLDNVYVSASTVVGRFRLSGRVDETQYDFKNNLQDYRDRKETAGSVRVEYALSPDTRLVGQVGANKRRYDLNTPFASDSTGSDVLFGINSSLTHLINGEILVGYTEQKYDDPNVGKVDGFAVRGRVEWLPTQLTTVTFTGSREVDDTGVLGADGVLTTREGVRVDHELLRNVLLTGGVSVAQADYKGVIDRSDDWVDADVGATYLMNRHVGIEATYYYSDYSSDGANAGRNYNVNRFMVSLKLKL
jgi:hypothetical protein